MSLKSILVEKNKQIDILINQFSEAYSDMYPAIFKEIQSVFKKGIFEESVIRDIFRRGGVDDLVVGFIDEFAVVYDFSKKLSKELGVGFNLASVTNEKLDAALVQIENNFNRLTNKYVNELTTAGLNANLADMKFQDVVRSLASIVEDSSRRFIAEAYTGITQFDRALNYNLFKESLIEKYYYFGPSDDKTRQICQDALNDPKQQTGWTIDDINNSETTFIECGGYNCRHEWLPLVE